MRKGQMRHILTIQRQGQAVDEYGAPIFGGGDWVDVVTVWGALEAMRGSEYFAAKQIQSSVTQRIRVRYLPEIKPAMRVKNGDAIYNIVSVLPDNRRSELVLMCEEISNEQ